jgi:hypothetical protein
MLDQPHLLAIRAVPIPAYLSRCFVAIQKHALRFVDVVSEMVESGIYFQDGG